MKIVNTMDTTIGSVHIIMEENQQGSFNVILGIESELLEMRNFSKYRYRYDNFYYAMQWINTHITEKDIDEITKEATDVFGLVAGLLRINGELANPEEDLKIIEEKYNQTHSVEWKNISEDERTKYFNNNIRKLHIGEQY